MFHAKQEFVLDTMCRMLISRAVSMAGAPACDCLRLSDMR